MNIGDIIPLYVQLGDRDASKYVRAFIRDSQNNNYLGSPVNLVAVDSNGLYANTSLSVQNQSYFTAQYVVYDDSGYTTVSTSEGAGLDVFNLDSGIEANINIPIYYQLFNYDATKYVRAYLRDDASTLLGSVNLSAIGSLGLYSNVSFPMPDSAFVTIQYVVFDDSGYTTPSTTEGAGLDKVFLTTSPFVVNSGITVSTLPNMGDAILEWFQPMMFTVVVKTIVNFQVVETDTPVSFRGVWQPLSTQELELKAAGQRAWSWYELHSDPSLTLKVDDIVNYLGVQYRVKNTSDYSKYGYQYYEMILDYQNAGPF